MVRMRHKQQQVRQVSERRGAVKSGTSIGYSGNEGIRLLGRRGKENEAQVEVVIRRTKWSESRNEERRGGGRRTWAAGTRWISFNFT